MCVCHNSLLNYRKKCFKKKGKILSFLSSTSITPQWIYITFIIVKFRNHNYSTCKTHVSLRVASLGPLYDNICLLLHNQLLWTSWTQLSSPALSFPSLSMSCTGVAAAPAHNACQDGGVVAENLRSPVQRCEDDAV